MKLKILSISFCSVIVCSTLIPTLVQLFSIPVAHSVGRCNFDLLLHEGGAHDGHTIAKHVAKSDLFLLQRLTNEGLPVASTYPNLKQAQRLTNAAICEDKAKLDDFLKNAQDRQILVFRKKSKFVTGKLVKLKQVKKDAYGVKVVVQKKSTFVDGLVIITSYPTDI